MMKQTTSKDNTFKIFMHHNHLKLNLEALFLKGSLGNTLNKNTII